MTQTGSHLCVINIRNPFQNGNMQVVKALFREKILAEINLVNSARLPFLITTICKGNLT